MGTGIKKRKKKLVEKVCGMWDPLFYIGFIIKSEWSELVECETCLTFMVKSVTLIVGRTEMEKSDNYYWTKGVVF